MVNEKQLRCWWRGIAEKEQFAMSLKARQLAFKYRGRKQNPLKFPKNAYVECRGLFNLKRHHSYILNKAEINAVGGIDEFKELINIYNKRSLKTKEFEMYYEFVVIENENEIELARLW